MESPNTLSKSLSPATTKLTFDIPSAVSVLILGVGPGVEFEVVGRVFVRVEVGVVFVADGAPRALVQVHLAVNVGALCAESIWKIVLPS